MLTTEQRNEMRLCIVGPCSEADLEVLRADFEAIGERVEPPIHWGGLPDYQMIVSYSEDYEEWESYLLHDGNHIYEPTITAADFIKTYLRK